MENLFLSILFIFSFIQLHAQTKNKLSAADSLHFCGYYKEEIVLRKAAPQNILENRILLDNAQVNLYLQSQEIEKAKTLFDKVLAEYE